MKNKIIIISGDPNSINSEIILKSWKYLSDKIKKRIYLISNYNLLIRQSKKINLPTKINKVKSLNDQINEKSLKVIDLDLKFKNPFKISKKNSSKFVISSLNLAHKLALNKDVAGIINCPINKNLLNRKKIGVTEFLASKCRIKKNTEVMLIKGRKSAVSPLTTHIDISQVTKKIKKKLITNKVETINKYYKIFFKKKPRIGILGLNPHNSENRKDSIEKKIILPTIIYLKKKKFNCLGPLVSDTIFIDEYKNYDVILGMYHDQVLSPFKAIEKFNAINITLGLRYLRVSPDHGTAQNLINKNKANPLSLINCIKFLSKF